MYDIRQVYQPKDLGEALSLLAEHPDAIVISGGTDVLIKVRERKWKDCSLLSIHRLPRISGCAPGEGRTGGRAGYLL